MKRKLPESGAIIAAVLLLIGLYVSSYLLLVERVVIIGDLISLEHSVTYSVGGEYAQTLFGPLHAIDRKLRPTYWGPSEPAIVVDVDDFGE
jgi:hypothetical protein